MAKANIELNGLPLTALAIANSIAKFVKTLVGRPMQVPIVNGLKRYLRSASNVVVPQNL